MGEAAFRFAWFVAVLVLLAALAIDGVVVFLISPTAGMYRVSVSVSLIAAAGILLVQAYAHLIGLAPVARKLRGWRVFVPWKDID